MSKYTPGPWVFNGEEIGPLSREDDQSYGMILPVAYIEQYDYPDEYTDNARLISAAPDLLEALQEIVAIHDDWIKAKLAIAKALGE